MKPFYINYRQFTITYQKLSVHNINKKEDNNKIKSSNIVI